MSSMWPSALASLDDSLAALEGSVQALEAARPVDLAQMIGRLESAAESARNLRESLLSETPEAQWQDRNELVSLLQARDVARRRTQLRALAAELERGSLSHRRAARVAQLNQLRSHAVEELQAQAEAKKAPPALPGPDAELWVQWACALKEPDDTASLQSLRAGFPRLDEFVAGLEPGMWAAQESEGAKQAASQASSESEDTKELEQRRARLLALATELERGEVVHHRAMRVTQVNQLREQAIQELRLQAVVARPPAILPGPEPEQWMQWACGLKEPDDARDLQALRDGFGHLDEFIANLEPGMWVPAVPMSTGMPSPPPPLSAGTASPPPPEASAQTPSEPARMQSSDREEPRVTPQIEPDTHESAVSDLMPPESKPSSRFPFHISPRVAVFWRGRWRVLLPTAVLLIALFGAMQWHLHRTHASNLVKPAEVTAPEAAEAAPSSVSTPDASKDTTSVATHTPQVSDKAAKPKDATAAAKPQIPAPPPEKQVSLLNDAVLRTPEAMPKAPAPARPEDASSEAPGAVPGTLPGGVPNSVTNIVKDVPVITPKPPAQKLRISSGVAQGQLVHQVTPIYPTQARQASVHGTVVLQAVVGKDGKVQNVRALSGPPMLIKPAVDAVKQWRYKPFTVNGEPTEADIDVNVNFSP